jgi:hypothetical protein
MSLSQITNPYVNKDVNLYVNSVTANQADVLQNITPFSCTGSSDTLTANDVKASIGSWGVTGGTCYLPQAADLIDAFPNIQAKDVVKCRLTNNTGYTVTFSGTTGATVIGSPSMSAYGSKDLNFYITNVISPAYTLYY